MGEPEFGNRLAPEGFVWMCAACGKRSRDRYGFQRLDRGYDVSCALNAELVLEPAVLPQARDESSGV
jgi:hypothetical protein